MATWEITDKEVQALWTEIWPKIVALAWLDEVTPLPGARPAPYRTCFERSHAFRQQEVQRIAGILMGYGLLRLEWTSDIPICLARPKQVGIVMDDVKMMIHCLHEIHAVEEASDAEQREDLQTKLTLKWSCPDALYGDTYFYINHKGIVLPWPDRPTLDEIFIGYAQGGGSLPRIAANGGPPWGGSTLTPAEDKVFTDLTNIPWNCKPDPWQARPVGLSGVALITLFEKWGEVIGGSWMLPGAANHIRTNLRAYIMPEVWANWPSFLREDHSAAHNFVIEGDPAKGEMDDYMDISVPVPAPPDPPHVPSPTEEEIFKELIVGQATNPMYSNCY